MFITSLYIFKRLCATIAILCLIFVVLLWLTQSLKFLEIIVNNNISTKDYLSLIACLLPDLFVKVTPVCVLIGGIITYSKLTIDNEIQVMQALGKSPWQIMMPGISVAFSLTFILLFLNIFTIPSAFRSFKNQEFQLRNQFSSSLIKEGGFNALKSGITIFVEKRVSPREFEKVFIHNKGKASSNAYTIFAKKGFLNTVDNKHVLILENGVRQEKDKRNIVHSFAFEKIVYGLDEFTKIVNSRGIKPYERDLKDIFQTDIPKAENEKVKARLSAEGHQRLLIPFLCVFNILIVAVIMIANQPSRRLRRKRMVWLIFGGIIFQWLIVNLLQIQVKFKFSVMLAYFIVIFFLFFLALVLKKGSMHRKIQKVMQKCGI